MNKTGKTSNNKVFLVCRACLAFDIKIYAISPQLQQVYEKLTNTKLSSHDGKPRTVCYICMSLLKRCYFFANMCDISESIFTMMLQSSHKLTKELVSKHTSKINNNYYTTPAVTYSITPNIINNSNPVTVKTEIIQDQAIDETSGKILNMNAEHVKLEDEQEMEDDFLANKDKPIVCEKWKELATCEKEQYAVGSEQVIFKNEHVILIRKPVSKHVIDQNAIDIKQILKTIKDNKKSTPPISERENKMDQFNTKLTQELDDGLTAFDNEPLREDREEPEKRSSEECILILSDEDEEMPVRNDQSIPIEDDEDLITDENKNDNGASPAKSLEPLLNNGGIIYYACSVCSKTYNSTALLQKHIKSHKYSSKDYLASQLWMVPDIQKSHKCKHCDQSFSRKSSLLLHTSSHKNVYNT